MTSVYSHCNIQLLWTKETWKRINNRLKNWQTERHLIKDSQSFSFSHIFILTFLHVLFLLFLLTNRCICGSLSSRTSGSSTSNNHLENNRTRDDDRERGSAITINFSGECKITENEGSEWNLQGKEMKEKNPKSKNIKKEQRNRAVINRAQGLSVPFITVHGRTKF